MPQTCRKLALLEQVANADLVAREAGGEGLERGTRLLRSNREAGGEGLERGTRLLRSNREAGGEGLERGARLLRSNREAAGRLREPVGDGGGEVSQGINCEGRMSAMHISGSAIYPGIPVTP